MSRIGRISSKAEKAVKTAKSSARSAVSKSSTTVWKKGAATGHKAVAATGLKKSASTSFKKRTPPKSGNLKGSVAGTVGRVSGRRPTPVQMAAAEGVTTHKQNGVTVASDTDVLRIARAVAEHRKGLMDRLAK